MAAFACVLGLAAGLACDPDRATNPLHQVGARASLANQDSVSVVNLCGPRMSIRNANDDSIAVLFYANTYQPAQALVLPKRPTGEPFSETFVFMTNPQNGASLSVGTRFISMVGGPACPTRPAVPALAPPPPSQSVVDAGSAFLLPDTSYGGWHISFRRFFVKFVDGTPQPIRQAVFDAVNATVLGGGGLGVGKYYIDVPLPLDSGVGPRNAVWNRLLRNSAVKWAVAEYGDDVIAPTSVTPNDGPSWKTWKLDSVDISHAGWHLEMDRAPLAWGCSTGGDSVAMAMVDAGLEPNSDVPVTSSGPVGPTPFLLHHASFVSSILRANGNNGTGMTGMVWNGKLTYFWASDAFTVVPGLAPGEPLYKSSYSAYAVMRAIASGARVVNISLGLDWFKNGRGHWPLTRTDSQLVESAKTDMSYALERALGRLDSANRQRPLIVIAAGNNAVNAEFSGLPGVMLPDQSAFFRDQVLVVGGLAKDVTPRLWVGTGRIGPTLLDGSNRGDLIDILAPAEQIHALRGGDVDIVVSGTSYAAPQVVGVAAMALGMNPTLSGAQLKQLILKGAANGNRYVDAGDTVQHYVAALNAYETLREVARTSSAPLCGNRVWADANRILVTRDTMPASIVGETIVTASKPIKSVSTYHGGRKLRAWYTDGTNEMFLLANGTWAAGVAPPESLQTSITGAAFSQFGYSHGGDTLLTTSIMPNADSAAVLFRTFVPPDLFNPVSTATKSIVYLPPSDSLTCTYQVEDVPFGLVAPGNPSLVIAVGPRRMRNGQIGDPSVRCHGFTRSTMQPIARQVTAYSPTGRFAYVAINRQLTRFVSPDANWVAWCDPASAALNVGSWCRGGVMRQVPTGVTIARLNLATSVLDTVWNDATANVHTLAVSENGAELAYTLSRDTVSWTLPPKFELQSQPVPWGRYDFVGYPVLSSSGKCYQAYLVLASNVTALRESASGCAAQPLALSTFSSVVASARSKESRSPHQGARR